MAQEEKYKQELEMLNKVIQEQNLQIRQQLELERELSPPHPVHPILMEISKKEDVVETTSQPQEEKTLKLEDFTALEEELKKS